MKKRILCFLLTILLTVSLLVQAAPVTKAASYITDPTQISGSSFSAVYATKLDNIFYIF